MVLGTFLWLGRRMEYSLTGQLGVSHWASYLTFQREGLNGILHSNRLELTWDMTPLITREASVNGL